MIQSPPVLTVQCRQLIPDLKNFELASFYLLVFGSDQLCEGLRLSKCATSGKTMNNHVSCFSNQQFTCVNSVHLCWCGATTDLSHCPDEDGGWEIFSSSLTVVQLVNHLLLRAGSTSGWSLHTRSFQIFATITLLFFPMSTLSLHPFFFFSYLSISKVFGSDQLCEGLRLSECSTSGQTTNNHVSCFSNQQFTCVNSVHLCQCGATTDL